MKISLKISFERFIKIGKAIYTLAFQISIFIIAYGAFPLFYFKIIRSLNFDVFEKNGELKKIIFNHFIFIAIALSAGFLGGFFYSQKKWIRKISFLLILTSPALSMIFSEMAFYELRRLQVSPLRLEKLVAIYGNAVDPCKVLHIGDDIKKILSYYKKSEYQNFEINVSGNKEKYIDYLFLPINYDHSEFTIRFVPNSLTTIEIECFNEEWKKSKNAKPINNFNNYINE